MLADCTCDDWKANTLKINAALHVGALHGYPPYTGKEFIFCPWCGTKRAARPELEELLEHAKAHVMTPQEIWDQRVSFVFGQLMDSTREITREEVEKTAAEIYGPRPSD